MGYETALKEACMEADALYTKSFFEWMDSTPDVIIPEEKDARLRNFIKNYNIYLNNTSANRKSKGMKRGIKVMLIAAIILLIAALTAFAIEPVRSFVYKICNDYTEFIFEKINDNKNDYLIAEYTYIPEGYQLVSNEKKKTEHTVIFRNGQNRIKIHSDQTNGSVLLIDTEAAKTRNLKINDYDGYYSVNQDTIILVWSTGKFYHVITADVCDKLTLNDVVQIAQSARKAL